ncbi:tRNA dimethylallyltransferase [mine drainage metagenome]|uniref:tRNA dimethylallyltransferase n=1 Tax=mine drainage metagenome TaxID=410659 RepID=A0A1J5P539_9ZZZZ
MWEMGFVEEVQKLERMGLREGKTAQRSLGYGQILRALDGEISLEAAKDETIKATRKFSRRQNTWFARDAAISWCSVGAHIDRLEMLY